MELAHLASFVAVADELHFSRAAERRHVSQPAMTKHIRQLESSLGLTLFVRDRRSVRLTPHGRTLLTHARSALAAVDGVRDLAGRLRRGEAGLLRIGFTPTAPTSILPGLMKAFRRRYPAVEYELVEASSQEQLAQLRAATLDVGVLRPPLHGRPADVAWQPVLTEPFVLAVPSGHRAARRSPTSLARLAGERLVLVSRRASPDVYDYLVAKCHAAGLAPEQAREASQMPAALGLVGAGCGVALVPASARALGVREVSFVALRDRLVSELGVAWATGHESPLVARFAEVARQVSRGAPRPAVPVTTG